MAKNLDYGNCFMFTNFMNKKFFSASCAFLLSPALAGANPWAAQPTVEVNLAALEAIKETEYLQDEQSFEIATRPPAPRYEAPAGYPAPPVYERPIESQPEESPTTILGIEGSFSGNVAVTSEYAFRGVTQTREGPAIQGGVDYEHPTGAYVGLWASSVDFGDADEASTEFDYYGGYSWEVVDGLTADVGAIYYNYPAADSSKNYDFVEGYVGLGYDTNLMGQDVSTNATLNVSPDYFAASGQSYYLKVAASTPVTEQITVDGSVAHQWIEDEAAFALPDYADWSLGVAYALEDYELKLQYIDTSLNSDECADGCDAKAIMSLSKSL